MKVREAALLRKAFRVRHTTYVHAQSGLRHMPIVEAGMALATCFPPHRVNAHCAFLQARSLAGCYRPARGHQFKTTSTRGQRLRRSYPNADVVNQRLAGDVVPHVLMSRWPGVQRVK